MLDVEKPSNPGKTAPRLLADLNIYDLRTPDANALVDFPASYDTAKGPSQTDFPPPQHQHTLLLKPEQSDIFLNTALDTEKRYVVATVCQSCRIHIDLSIAFPLGLGTTLCGRENERFPLHHFQYLKTHSSGNDERGNKGAKDRRVFRCSSSNCGAKLTITSKGPMLDSNDKKVLSDRSLYPERAKMAEKTHPNEGPFDPLSPAEALRVLHTYLSNVLLGKRADPIPRYNKRLLHNLGKDADTIFRKAHFELEINDESDGHWKMPFLSDDVKSDLEDLVTELKILSQTSPFRESTIQYSPKLAEKKLCQLLAYETNFQSRPGASNPYIPRYANLGAVGNFSDNLINWCYKRQVIVDPHNSPYYLECLMDIANGRRSEFLQMAVATYRSENHFSTSDVREAYQSLGLDPDIDYAPDVIIGKFRAFISDSPRSEAQMRQALLMIGTALNSQFIIQAASKAPMDVNQAYEYFGATPETDASFLITLYQLKIKDQPTEESAAKDALRLIANKLSSTILTEFLESGNMFQQSLDLSTAYSRLGGAEHLPDDALIATYNISVNDGGNVNDHREALRIIGESRNSSVIRTYLSTGEIVSSGVHSNNTIPRGRDDWPVGLCNIGNTCYLNSLLQFYFTIKPLRDMILHFDMYKEDLSEEILQTKRVGGRKVSVQEVERAMKFVGHLRALFQNMISSKDASVTPETELAKLALASSKEEAKGKEEKAEDKGKAEKTHTSADEPPPPITLDDDLDSKMDVDNNETSQTMDDAGSEITLVDKIDAKANDEDFVMIESDKKADISFEDKENLPPPKTESTPASGIRPALQDININETELTNLPGFKGPQAPPTPPPEMPDRPPPIPPRPTQKPLENETDFMFNRQQDVAECIENVMFQIEAAVKPSDHDENGEQVDLVKRLFYGKTKQLLKLVGSAESRSKIELWSHLIVHVAEGSNNIYSALDALFDVTTVNLEGKDMVRYLSISELPPVLQLQVQRVQFDRNSGKAYKSTAHLKFPETIYMDRYLDSKDPELQVKREEAWTWKTEIAALEKRKARLANTLVNLYVPEALSAVKSWINEVYESEDKDLLEEAKLPEILDGLEDGIKISTHELKEINQRLQELQSKTSTQFEGLHNHGYRIHSVFMHRGTATFGHYWIYIYDYKEKLWRKYNDEYVTTVTDTKEVFEHLDSANSATPYFLVFVKEQETERGMVEAVERKIVDSVEE